MITKAPFQRQTQIARRASLVLGNLKTEQKNQVLRSIAMQLRKSHNAILAANHSDLLDAKERMEAGEMTSSLYKRLVLDENKIEQMACNMESVAELPDPVGTVQKGTRLLEGLELYQVSCPIGVILVIFESRPEVVVQIAALALKSGNAVILKGGSEAKFSNQSLAEILEATLATFDYMPAGAIQLLNTRGEVSEVLEMSHCIDLVIPRGSKQLVEYIQAHSKAPILAHADGICHVYLDEFADLAKAKEIILDAKTQYPAVCNAMETLLVHEKVDTDWFIGVLKQLQAAQVELRFCEKTSQWLGQVAGLSWKTATPADWVTEYTDLILSVKTVASLEEAVAHINEFGSKHTDAIVTENKEHGEWFMNQVDAASVFWNVSTRFADGFRYGLGAEVGISTSKTHARGPVGLEGLVIYKYKMYGQGHSVRQVTDPAFLHEAIE